MKNYNEAIRWGAIELRNANIASPRLDARLLLQYSAGLSHEKLLLEQYSSLSESVMASYEEAIFRRKNREPVAVIVGETEFWSLPFYTSDMTLDPRPDSETVVETALKLFPDIDKPLQVLDLGTGTGCLLISILSEFKQAQGLAVDISCEALEVAKRNIKRHNMENNIQVKQSNWCEKLEGKFDLIISNPPYIPKEDIEGLEPEVKQFDPLSALDGGDDGLDPYRLLAKEIQVHLVSGGKVIFEIGQGQEEDVRRIMQQSGFDHIEDVADLSGIIRCTVFTRN